jgi:hypothetical protein
LGIFAVSIAWLLKNKTGEQGERIEIVKEEDKLSVFEYDINLYIKDPKKSTKINS